MEKAKIQSFRELIVWHKSMELSLLTYCIAAKLPSYENFGLASQIRRASTSIPANISEGHKRGSRKDFAQFLRIASESAAELETHFELIHRIHNLPLTKELLLLNEIQRMLTSIIKKLI